MFLVVDSVHHGFFSTRGRAPLIRRAVLCALLGAYGLYAQDLSASGDAFVDTFYPNLNFGTANYLQTGGTTKTYVRFDLSSLPTALLSSPNARVNLSLWVGRLGAAGNLQVSQAAGAWSELTVTSNNQPGAGASVGLVAVSTAGQFVYLDMTDVVLGWMNTPSTNFGLVISGVAPAIAFLDSKESVTTSHGPTLQFVASGPAGATGATGAIGVAGVTGSTGVARSQ